MRISLKSCASHRVIGRALATVLSFSIFWSASGIISYAYTVDDLRAFTGKHRICTNENRARLASIIQSYGEMQQNNALLDQINSSGFNENVQSNFNKALDEMEILNNNIKDSFKTKNALEIIGMYKQAKLLSDKIDSYNMDGVYFVKDGEKVSTEEYNKALEEINWIRSDMELGEIGAGLKNIVNTNKLEVYEPYGDIIEEYTYTIRHNNGMYIKNASSGSDVLALWNGIVEEVVDSEDWGKYVVVRCGDALTYSASFLNSVNVAVGDKVRQYDVLGRGRDKYVYLEIILDNQYVDPVFIFGHKGVDAYSDWMFNNGGRLVDVVDYNLVKDDIVSLDDIEIDIEKSLEDEEEPIRSFQ